MDNAKRFNCLETICLLLCSLYSHLWLIFWIPTIIKSLSEVHTTNLEIGWLSMLPSLVAIPSALFVGWNAIEQEI